jgi:hypothetical protein
MFAKASIPGNSLFGFSSPSLRIVCTQKYLSTLGNSEKTMGHMNHTWKMSQSHVRMRLQSCCCRSTLICLLQCTLYEDLYHKQKKNILWGPKLNVDSQSSRRRQNHPSSSWMWAATRRGPFDNLMYFKSLLCLTSQHIFIHTTRFREASVFNAFRRPRLAVSSHHSRIKQMRPLP